jgi:hypothetical protein
MILSNHIPERQGQQIGDQDWLGWHRQRRDRGQWRQYLD